MKLATQTDVVSQRFGDNRAVEIFSETGYNALDYSMFGMKSDTSVLNSDQYRDYAKRLRSFADHKGISFTQAHAPFEFNWNNEDFCRNVIHPRIIRSMEICSLLGADKIVIHPIHHFVYAGHEPELRQINMRFYESLIPYCQEYSIKIAVENMYQRDEKRKCIVDDVCSRATELAGYVDELNGKYRCFVACLDVGHCSLVGEEAQDAIRILGKERLQALHIHDNGYTGDDHTIPGLGKMDWDAITSALSEIGYTGDFTYEADNFLKGFQDALIPAAVRFMHDVGRYWAGKIE